MNESSYWWRWLMVLVLPILLWQSKEEKIPVVVEALPYRASVTPPSVAEPKSIEAKPAEAKQLIASLPTTAQLRADETRDFHHVPSEVLEGGAAIGRYTEQLKANPEKMAEGLAFYESCAKNEEILDALRAVCLRTLWDLSEKLGKAAERTYPAQLRFIAESLPPTRW